MTGTFPTLNFCIYLYFFYRCQRGDNVTQAVSFLIDSIVH